MARRYDSRTTIFSPEGRLYQVEYAMEAISNAGAAIGMLAKDGVVLVAEKKVTSKVRRACPDGGRLLRRLGAFWCGMHAKPLQTPEPAAPLTPQLLDTHAVGVRREKMYKLDDHIACAVAGITCEHRTPCMASRLGLEHAAPLRSSSSRPGCDHHQRHTDV